MARRLLGLPAAIVALGIILRQDVPSPSAPVGAWPGAPRAAEAASAETFAGYADDATRLLETSLFNRSGSWYLCATGCRAANVDWGADSLTYTAYLRWRSNPDPVLLAVFGSLASTAQTYGPCTSKPQSCPWSDVPEWDSIADSREFAATRDSRVLSKAQAAYNYVTQSKYFALGACPDIRYQIPLGGGGGLKTLETDANAVKAALLLYAETKNAQYLTDAERLYTAIRRRYLDATIPLYTVYVFDDGSACRQVPRRFFGSVNGDMIYNSLYLYRSTGKRQYLADALATTHAVNVELSDGRGVYADLQAENDIVEPLVEAMYDMAVVQGDAEARTWLVANARAALLQDRSSKGFYGRFFDGPTPTWNVTAWQTNGGLALAIVAGGLQPSGTADLPTWNAAKFVSYSVTTLPSPPIRFNGSGIAVIGAIGDRCCQPGHATVFLDGVETIDQTGIWQNKSSSGLRIANAVLFAWRWPASGSHTIQFGPGAYNAKEGGPYLNAIGYDVLP